MDKLIGFCGLVCSECPAFIATQNDDDIERERIAKEWAKAYKHDFKIEDINCDGCVSTEGRHIGYCGFCEIRACAIQKTIKNCAYCEDYICEKLNKFFDMAPHAKKSLGETRKNV
jgi:hypothetical protein